MLSQSPRTACGCHEFPLLPHCTCLAPMSVRSKMEKVFGEEEPAALVFVKCWCPPVRSLAKPSTQLLGAGKML